MVPHGSPQGDSSGRDEQSLTSTAGIAGIAGTKMETPFKGHGKKEQGGSKMGVKGLGAQVEPQSFYMMRT